MNMDKNTIIGFVLIAVLVVGFMWYSKPSPAELALQQHIQDSTFAAQNKKTNDSLQAAINTAKRDTNQIKTQAGIFSAGALGTEQFTVVENDVLKAIFSNKGGRLKSVELKGYKTFTGKNVMLSGAPDDNMAYVVNGTNNAQVLTSTFYFPQVRVDSANGTKTVSFTLPSSAGQTITHQYIIKNGSYMIDWNIVLDGANSLLPQGMFNFQWQLHPLQHERTASYERLQTNVCFEEGNDFNYISAKNTHKFELPIQWVGVVQQFFNTTVISKNNFSAGDVQWQRKSDTTNVLGDVSITMQQKIGLNPTATIPLQLYFGPNEYHILQNQAPDMDKMVNLGRDMYSFVRPINKYIIMPVFNFFGSIVSNFGWAILFLTLFIRLVTSPLTYSSYLSGAKMKVLRPELDAIKKKLGADQQAFAVEQMKLFKEAGVNPLGGCIPALLQIPIFFALYSFFNSNISLRGVHFLWAQDLSSADTFIHFNSDVWLIGDHIGLFTLTAIITSFLISLYNMNNTPAQGPNAAAMKYMPYIFPFVLFFVFNKLPSALTWYYTVSNIITLAIQFVIQTYIIDHTKILAQIDVKRKAPKKQSKFQDRYTQMLEAQKKVQDLKNKGQQGKK